MAIIPVQAFLYPAILPTFAKFKDLIDPRIATDHKAIWQILLALENALGLNPSGSFSTVEARVRNAMRIQMRIVTAPNTGGGGFGFNWRDGLTVNWNDGTGAIPSPIANHAATSSPWLLPPTVICAYLGDASDDNHPSKFWVDGQNGTVFTLPSISACMIKARSRTGAALSGVSTHTVSVMGIGAVEPAE